MRKIFVVLIAMIGCFQGFSQDQHAIDSLLQRLVDHKIEKSRLKIASPSLYDTTAADLLYVLSRKYSNDLETGMNYLEQSLKLSEQISYKKGMGMAYYKMGGISESQGNYLQSLDYYKKGLEIWQEIGVPKRIAGTYNNMGLIYNHTGNFPEALKSYLQALKINEETGNTAWQCINLNNIAKIQMDQSNFDEAIKTMTRTLNISTESGDKMGIGSSNIGLGTIAMEQLKPKEALARFSTSLELFQEIGDLYGVAISYTNIGGAYLLQENHSEALKNFLAAMEMNEKIGNKFGVVQNNLSLGEAYLTVQDYKNASDYLNKALHLSNEIGALELQKLVYQRLSELHTAQGNNVSALEYYKLFITARDSVLNNENTRKTVTLQMNYEFNKKHVADSLIFASQQALVLEKNEKQRIGLFAAGGGLLLLLALAFSIYTGKKKSDELLLNILPYETAQELKKKGHSDAKLIDDVTVLFTDFKGFTAMAEQLSAKDLVEDLNVCFSEFDRIMGKYGIEKIKTIGDAYMAAGGLPVPNSTHAQDVVKAAFEMRDFVEAGKAKKIEQGLPYFEIRIGVHTGPVVAGIVGVKKYSYDIWGDTVNTASRMESSGEVGKVNVSETTYDLVKDDFLTKPRGEIEAKGKGKIKMFFVERG